MREIYNNEWKEIRLLSKVRSFMTFCLLVTLSFSVAAQNYSVTDATDGTATTQLRGAIVAADLAGGTHTITVAAGSYDLSLGEISF